MRRWNTLLCRMLGHRWTEYANAEPVTPLSPWPVSWVFGVQCVRCDVRSGPTFRSPSRP